MSPTRQPHARNQTAIRQFAETNPAQAELAIHGSRPTAQFTTSVVARAEFRFALRLGDF
jgi:hypothetical protein